MKFHNGTLPKEHLCTNPTKMDKAKKTGTIPKTRPTKAKSPILDTSRKIRATTRSIGKTISQRIVDKMIADTTGNLNQMTLNRGNMQPSASTSAPSAQSVNVSEVVQPNEQLGNPPVAQSANTHQANIAVSQQQQVATASSQQPIVTMTNPSNQQLAVTSINQQAATNIIRCASLEDIAHQSQEASNVIMTPAAPNQASLAQHNIQPNELLNVAGPSSAFVPIAARSVRSNEAGDIRVAVHNIQEEPIGAEFVEADEVNGAADIMYRTIRIALKGMQRIEDVLDGPEELLFPALKSQLTLLERYRQRVYECLDKLEPAMTYVESARLESDLLDVDEVHSVLLTRVNGLIQERFVHTPTPSSAPSTSQSTNMDWEKEMRHFQIEKFGGDFLKWPKFKELFETFVHNNERRTPAAKFLLLDHSLIENSEAAATISGLERHGDNYEAAWSNLCRTYDNPLKLVEDATDRFLNLPHVRGPTREEIMSIINGVNHLLASMPKYGVDTAHWDVLLVQLIRQKLDHETVRRWTYERPMREIPKLAPFLDYLRKISESIDPNATAARKPSSNAATSNPSQQDQSGKRIRPPIRCLQCKKEHSIYACPQFRSLSVTERQERVRGWGVCRNCLKRNCSPERCTLRACTKCNVKHNGLLCTAPLSQPKTNTMTASSNNMTE